VQRSGGQVDVRVADGLLDVGERDTAGREQIGIELDADRVLLRAKYLHRPPAADGGDPLREQVFGVIVDDRQWLRIGRQREIQNGEVRRIDLALGRGRRQRRGQRASGGGERRLHVLRGGVDVAVERELERDGRLP